MKISVLTGDQPRHTALLHKLAALADNVYALVECTPNAALVPDANALTDYFARVHAAEAQVFPLQAVLPDNLTLVSLARGAINTLELATLTTLLQSDLIIVFGSSYIKGELAEALIQRKALNLHMGISPYYRGTACNFWALYDGHPELIGATIHYLSRGLDDGDILFHATPTPQAVCPFVYGMLAVAAAQDALLAQLEAGEIKGCIVHKQVKAEQLRYSRSKDFNETIAAEFLAHMPSPQQLFSQLRSKRKYPLIFPAKENYLML